jgi:hypothetical protein
MKVSTYSVLLRRDKDANGTSRHFILTGEEPIGNIQQIHINFTDPEPNADWGYSHNSGAVVYLPMRDFADMYHLLQTEKQVHVNFVADENNILTLFTLSMETKPVE